MTRHPSVLRNAVRAASYAESMCWLPSNSTASLTLRHARSRMYRPTTNCRVNRGRTPERRRQTSRSASVAPLRSARARSVMTGLMRVMRARLTYRITESNPPPTPPFQGGGQTWQTLPSLKGRGRGWVGRWSELPPTARSNENAILYFAFGAAAGAAGTTAIVQSLSGRSHLAAVACRSAGVVAIRSLAIRCVASNRRGS